MERVLVPGVTAQRGDSPFCYDRLRGRLWVMRTARHTSPCPRRLLTGVGVRRDRTRFAHGPRTRIRRVRGRIAAVAGGSSRRGCGCAAGFATPGPFLDLPAWAGPAAPGMGGHGAAGPRGDARRAWPGGRARADVSTRIGAVDPRSVTPGITPAKRRDRAPAWNAAQCPVLCGFGEGEWLAWPLPCVAVGSGLALGEGSPDTVGDGVALWLSPAGPPLGSVSSVAQYCLT